MNQRRHSDSASPKQARLQEITGQFAPVSEADFKKKSPMEAHRLAIILTAIPVAIYVAALPLIFPLMGPLAFVFSLVPTIIAAIWGSMWFAVSATAALALFHLGAIFYLDLSDVPLWQWHFLLGSMGQMLIAASLGRMSDLSKRLKVETDKHQVARQAINELAFFDTLTGLPNRDSFVQILDKEIARMKRNRSRLGVLHIDVDRLKGLNNTIGYTTVDHLLSLVASRIKNSLRESDTVARLGSDEFVVLVSDIKTPDTIGNLINRIFKSVESKEYKIGEHTLNISVSAGLAMYPSDGETVDKLVKNAEAALNSAKQAGYGRFQLFNRSLEKKIHRRIILEKDLNIAIGNGQIFNNYQPIVDANTGAIHSLECLVRWDHPKLRLVPPLEFIHIAEETGQIGKLGRKVLDEACAHLAQWRKNGFPRLRLAFNVSVVQLRDAQFIESTNEIIDRHGLLPNDVELEITESIVLEGDDIALITLHTLKNHGYRLAIDDFGTGYASLSYLQRLPIQTVKIDKSFVAPLPGTKEYCSIVVAVIAMSKALGLNVVAEGVETKEQLSFLEEIECNQVQGYLISRPIPHESVRDLLIENQQTSRPLV